MAPYNGKGQGRLYLTYDNPSQNLITTVAPSKTRGTTTTMATNSVTTAMSPIEEATESFMHELLSANGDKEMMEDQVRSGQEYDRKIIYRVTLVVEYLGWVDLDLGSSYCTYLLPKQDGGTSSQI